jgi:hypothetical protein
MTTQPFDGVTRCLICLASVAAVSAQAAEPASLSAQDVFNKVSAAYSHLSSIRVGVKWEETLVRKGQAGEAESEY